MAEQGATEPVDVLPHVNLLERAEHGSIFEVPEWQELYEGGPQSQVLNLAMLLSTATRASNCYYVTKCDMEEVFNVPSQTALMAILENVYLAGIMLDAGDQPPFAYRILHNRLLEAFNTGNPDYNQNSFLSDLERIMLITHRTATDNGIGMNDKIAVLTYITAIRTTTEGIVRERLTSAIETSTAPETHLGIHPEVLKSFANAKYWNGRENEYWTRPQENDQQMRVWALRADAWLTSDASVWPKDVPPLVDLGKLQQTDFGKFALDATGVSFERH